MAVLKSARPETVGFQSHALRHLVLPTPGGDTFTLTNVTLANLSAIVSRSLSIGRAFARPVGSQ
jgi:hypothetical protein